MLQLTPEAIRIIRSAQEREAVKARRKRKQKAARKLKREHRRRLIDGVAEILKQGEPTKFAFEAFCRHDLRSGLCLAGWPWADADTAAADVVQAALRLIGAYRPSWQQGQPEYVQFGVSFIERTRCVTCHGKLPEGHRLYCSSTCFESKRIERRQRFHNAYDWAVNRGARYGRNHVRAPR